MSRRRPTLRAALRNARAALRAVAISSDLNVAYKMAQTGLKISAEAMPYDIAQLRRETARFCGLEASHAEWALIDRFIQHLRERNTK